MSQAAGGSSAVGVVSAAPGGSARLYAINAASSVTARILQLAGLLWVNQFLLRHVGPDEYSLVPLVMSLVLLADVAKNIATGGITRYLVEADARGESGRVTAIVSSMLPVLLAVAVSIMVAAGLLAWKLDAVLSIRPVHLDDARLMLLLMAATLSITVLATPLAEGLYIRQRFTLLNGIELGTEVLRIGLLLLLLLGLGPRALWLAVTSICATLASVIVRIALTHRSLPAIRFRPASFDWSLARTVLGFGAWTSVQGLTTLVANAVPALLLNRHATAFDVSCYHLGKLPDTQLRRLADAAALPAQPALTSLYATGGAERLHELYFRGGRYHLWATLLAAAPLLVFARPVVDLYVGAHYAPTPIVIVALLAAYPVVWASAMFYRISHAIGRVGRYYVCDVVVQCSILAAMYGAVAWGDAGAAGAALAVVITDVSLHLLLVWPLGLRLVKGRWSDFLNRTVLPGLLPFAAALLFGLGVEALLAPRSWTTLGLAALGMAAAYLATLVLFCLDAPDRELLTRSTRRAHQALFSR